jgi:hypothetical protein
MIVFVNRKKKKIKHKNEVLAVITRIQDVQLRGKLASIVWWDANYEDFVQPANLDPLRDLMGFYDPELPEKFPESEVAKYLMEIGYDEPDAKKRAINPDAAWYILDRTRKAQRKVGYVCDTKSQTGTRLRNITP